MAVDRPLSWPFACLGTIITGYAIGANKFIDNTYEEALLLNHCHRSAVARAPEQRSPPKAGFYASSYIIWHYLLREEQRPSSSFLLLSSQDSLLSQIN